MEKTAKRFFLWLTFATLAGLALFASFVYVTDPFVQYHLPFLGMSTVFSRGTQAYVNAGLAKNCNYDSVIVGSSVSENFYASDFDRIFGGSTLKLPYAGANTKTYSVILDTVFAHRTIKNVYYSLDLFSMTMDNSKPRYDLPMYLYDDNPLNDVNYLLNKDTLLYSIDVLKPHEAVSLDDAYNWQNTVSFGKQSVLGQFERPDAVEGGHSVQSWSTLHRVVEAGMQNVVDQIERHPETQFTVFYPPYSMVWFDGYQRRGLLAAICGAWERSMQMLLPYENVKIYAFCAWEDVVTDLSNYRESMHFSEDVNLRMVEAMGRDECRITKKNYREYIQELYAFVAEYDYDAIYLP